MTVKTTSTEPDARIPLADIAGVITAALDGLDLEAGTPEPHKVTAGILISALPEPDNDGTVDTREAARSVIQAVEARLPYPYTLRRDQLRERLTEEAERYEGTGMPSSSPAVPLSVLTCQWCSRPIPLARGPKARYCSNSHRVSAHRAKKRQQERQG